MLAALVVADLAVPGVGLPVPVWALVAVTVLGVLVAGVLAARRAWTVRVDPAGPDPGLAVGRERVPLADVDAAHLRAVAAGTAGVDAGASVLGGGGSLPRGRAGMPLRLAGGRTVLVPTRDPARLRDALLTALPAAPGETPSPAPERGPTGPAGGGVSDATDGDRRRRGTLGS